MSQRIVRLAMAIPMALSLTCLQSNTLHGFEPNYDEAKIPSYELPDPLVAEDGTPIDSPETWNKLRRPELIRLFERHVYGVAPQPCEVRGEVVTEKPVFGGRATRSEIDIRLGPAENNLTMRLLVYVPTRNEDPVPAFLGLNFRGNHSIDPDPAIALNPGWVRSRNDGTTDGHRSTEASRGVSADNWAIESIVDRGYALATIYYGDIDPDFDDGFDNGIHGVLGDRVAKVPQQHRWGSIAGWAYGLSRALDYLQSDPKLGIDADRVAVIGHSRLGKTALWAGAADERFALVISNNSGCGGAALSRRAFGETVGRINTSFPHWFCDQFNEYNENESELPVDQHQLVALMAPRSVYIASATEDRWADPRGEFLSAFHADPVFRLLGTEGMGGNAPPAEMPPAQQPVSGGAIGYHLREGKHDVTDYDWEQYLDFADRHLKKRP